MHPVLSGFKISLSFEEHRRQPDPLSLYVTEYVSIGQLLTHLSSSAYLSEHFEQWLLGGSPATK